MLATLNIAVDDANIGTTGLKTTKVHESTPHQIHKTSTAVVAPLDRTIRLHERTLQQNR